ncbi:MAG: FtsH protease activity modulator HflK [Oscillospiraceae bacterium]|nr:FtsH protease activity modulator HflK [Oscillospiraceae bacterium]
MEEYSYPFRDNQPPKKEKKSGKKLTFWIVCVLCAVVLGSVLLSSLYTIGEQENAVVTTFGVPRTVTEPGLHLKIPFVQQVRKVDMTIRSLAIGYDLNTGNSKPEESLMITSDYNFVNVDFFLEYRITDPVKYLYKSQDATAILKTLAQSYIRDTIGLYPVDDVITSGKSQIQAQIRDKITTRLDQEDLGVQLVNLTIQDAEPPTAEVLAAFKDVENAKQGKETALNNANKYRSEQLPAAEAEADRIVQQAQAAKESRINEASGQVARFEAMYAQYSKFPDITRQRMYFEAMEELLPGIRVIIADENGNQLNMFQFDTDKEVPAQ